MGQKAKGRKRKDVDEVVMQPPAPPEPQHQSVVECDHLEEEEEEQESTRNHIKRHGFNPATEQKLVEFFARNDCYYNKGSGRYANTKYRKRLLENLAKQLKTTDVRITKWFAGQRSTVGKLLSRPRSGSKAKALTARQKWQLTSFCFLKEFIIPRTRMYDIDELPGVEEEHVGEEEDLEVVSTTSSQRALASESKGGLRVTSESQVAKWPKESSAGAKIQDARLRFLERAQAPESIAMKMQESEAGPLDDKQAFGQWFCAKMLKVPENSWDEFEDAAHALLAKYTRQKPPAASHHPSQHQQSGLNQQQPQQQFTAWQPEPHQPHEVSEPPPCSNTPVQQGPSAQSVLPPWPHSSGSRSSMEMPSMFNQRFMGTLDAAANANPASPTLKGGRHTQSPVQYVITQGMGGIGQSDSPQAKWLDVSEIKIVSI